jgi:tetratricopeptide (TPR) repeat protein
MLVAGAALGTPPDENREVLARFADTRWAELQATAKAANRPVPDEYAKLFSAIRQNDASAVSNIYSEIRRSIGQYEDSKSDPRLHNELWQYALETYGAYEQFTLWTPSLLTKYARAYLREIPSGSILFGGTDPGRFVATAFCTSGKSSNIFVVTQNALADSKYVEYARHRYPDGILLPADQDIHRAFQQYVNELRQRAPSPEEQVEIVNGRVNIKGVAAVMNINGILTRWIFDRNQDQHAFYVEESYVIPWMYPHLEPAGLIMKLNTDPLPSPQNNSAVWTTIIKRDLAYWNKLEAELRPHPDFERDDNARKTFSKLRAAIGSLYAFRRLHAEAEYAFRQACVLCPAGPEANFRLAQFYMEQGRFDEAETQVRRLAKHDPKNKNIQQAIQQIQQARQTRQKP